MAKIRGKENYPFYFGTTTQIMYKAGILRKSMTSAESKLWQALRRRELAGFRFRRQHPINYYIADFFCYQAMLVVEVDGGYHLEKEQFERDKQRTKVINEFNIRVIRFTNDEVENNIDNVINEIMRWLPV
jgi:very-short-patch-repair endonuclease